MNKKTRKRWMCLLAPVFLISTIMLLRQFRDNAAGKETYQEALAIAAQTPETETTAPAQTTAPAPTMVWVPAPVEEDDPHLEEMASLDLAALRETNEDVVGWIRIPGTKIDYPLMQGQDNDYYLHHTWDNKRSSVGSIFIEQKNSPSLTDYHTILYGHNMNNGSMFAGLRKFSGETYRQEHPYVYIASDGGVLRYEIFSAYKADVDSITYGLGFQKDSSKEAFLNYILESSKIECPITPETTDRILTLSTCSGSGYTTRWVVHARLQMVEVPQ